MTQITASMVQELRQSTGVGMMDAKKALSENNGDMQAAIDYLRQKGLAKAAKKADRAAAEGLVCAITNGKEGALVEINSETDFVARNEQFQKFCEAVSKITLEKKGNLDAILSSPIAGASSVKEALTNLIATIGENMSIRRATYVSVSQGVVAAYTHNATVPGMGKIGVLVALESSAGKEKLEETGKHLAMHVAAANPLAHTKDQLDPSVVDREKNIFIEQAKESGKPEAVIEKMVEGRIRKFYEEVVLMEQTFIMDGERKITQVVSDAGKSAGSEIKLTGFARFGLGEGVEKKEEDFAAEVRKMAS